jgi:hypothetical protein
MGEGAALSMETSDVTLLDSNLEKIEYSIRMGQRVTSKIIQNVIFSIGVKFIVLGFALAGKTDLWAAIASDVGAMLIVTLNSMLLLPRRRTAPTPQRQVEDVENGNGGANCSVQDARVGSCKKGCCGADTKTAKTKASPSDHLVLFGILDGREIKLEKQGPHARDPKGEPCHKKCCGTAAKSTRESTTDVSKSEKKCAKGCCGSPDHPVVATAAVPSSAVKDPKKESCAKKCCGSSAKNVVDVGETQSKSDEKPKGEHCHKGCCTAAGKSAKESALEVIMTTDEVAPSEKCATGCCGGKTHPDVATAAEVPSSAVKVAAVEESSAKGCCTSEQNVTDVDETNLDEKRFTDHETAATSSSSEQKCSKGCCGTAGSH